MRVIALLLVVLSSCGSRPPAEGIPIGALLPFTGELAAQGSSLEHGLLSALDRVNAAGGVGGQPLRLVTRDTRSDPAVGLEQARQLIEEEQVLAVIGPEDAELTSGMMPLVASSGVLALTGGPISVTTADPPASWFRIIPPAERVGAALGERVVSDGVQEVALVYVDDPYGRAFSDVVRRTLEGSGRSVVSDIALPPRQTDFSNEVRPLASASPEAIVLVAYPTSGAFFLADWSGLGAEARWYFAPSLRADDFAQNVAPGLVEGSIGVSIALPADAGQFASVFGEEWDQEQPLTNAYFYFDSLVITGLAAEAASRAAGGGIPDRRALPAQVAAVTGPPGGVVTWQDVGRAFDSVRAGQDLDYRGASGSVNFDASGDVAQAVVEFWTIEASRITGL